MRKKRENINRSSNQQVKIYNGRLKLVYFISEDQMKTKKINKSACCVL